VFIIKELTVKAEDGEYIIAIVLKKPMTYADDYRTEKMIRNLFYPCDVVIMIK